VRNDLSMKEDSEGGEAVDDDCCGVTVNSIGIFDRKEANIYLRVLRLKATIGEYHNKLR
jgi:hypothetical protein